MTETTSAAAAAIAQAAAPAQTPSYANTITTILPQNIDDSPTYTERDIVSALSTAGIKSVTGLIVNKGGHNIELTITDHTERLQLLTTGLNTEKGHQRFRDFAPTTFAISIGNVPVEAPDSCITGWLAQFGLKVQSVTTARIRFNDHPNYTPLSGRRTIICDRPNKPISLPHTHRLPSGRIISIRHSGQGPRPQNVRDLPPAHKQSDEQISNYKGPPAQTQKSSFAERQRSRAAEQENGVTFMQTYELPKPLPTTWDDMISKHGLVHYTAWEHTIKNKNKIPIRNTAKYFLFLIKHVNDIEDEVIEYWQMCLKIAKRKDEHTREIEKLNHLIPVSQSNQFAALCQEARELEETPSQAYSFDQAAKNFQTTIWGDTSPKTPSFMTPPIQPTDQSTSTETDTQPKRNETHDTSDNTTEQDDCGENPEKDQHTPNTEQDSEPEERLNADINNQQTPPKTQTNQNNTQNTPQNIDKQDAVNGENPKRLTTTSSQTGKGEALATKSPDPSAKTGQNGQKQSEKTDVVTLDHCYKTSSTTQKISQTDTDVDRGGKLKKKKHRPKKESDSDSTPSEPKSQRSADQIDVHVGRFQRRISMTHLNEKLNNQVKLREDDVISALLVDGNMNRLINLDAIPEDLYISISKGVAALLHKHIGPHTIETGNHPKLRFIRNHTILPMWASWEANEQENNFTFGLVNQINQNTHRT